ncbi:IclR family transcriptional regulator [Azospirillum halopraeferens]|uniref:IclR family transcriptional regulator n=1 Tax=Azospirillum halopraeferens TaxID=34010 RepID=UPI000410DC9E|nr:IclR family transcriptional regulator [Azospirillum halopraeferens]
MKNAGEPKPEREAGEDGKDGTKGGVAAVERALSILAALEAEPEPLTLSELSRRTDLYKSTILRLLETLQSHGYVVRILDTRYALGPTVHRLGMAYERRNPLRHHVMPVMRRLVEEGTESPSFHIRQNDDKRLCLFRLDSRHSTLDRVNVGDLLPLDRGAAGRVILAFDGAAGEYYDRIRADAFAISLGERDPVCAGIAAPVFGPGGRFVGALSMSGPRERFTEENIATMRRQLVAAAQDISESLGGAYPKPAT